MIDKELKDRNLTWTAYCDMIGKNRRNFKRTLTSTIARVNSWLEPLGLEAKIIEKNKGKDLHKS